MSESRGYKNWALSDEMGEGERGKRRERKRER